MSKKILFALFCLHILMKEVVTDDKDCPGQQKCPSGDCTDNLQLCSSFISCQSKLHKCNQYVCTTREYKCVNQKCPKAYCWNNKCVDKQSDCPSISTCPLNDKNYVTKCHDRSCIENKEDCPNLKECPLFLPLKCPTGECRINLDDCPSLLKCPDQFQILCNDGSCQMTSDQCVKPSSQSQCLDPNMVRCSSGTCATSLFLCPTPKTCPRGYVMCWDSSCATSYDVCKKPLSVQINTCSDKDKIRCLDGSCRDTISSCPTMMVCPNNFPVRCWDNSCKETVDKCPKWQDCPDGTKQCPDGTCVINNPNSPKNDCGTQITCSADAPFKCYDNSCKRDPNDCSRTVTCPGKSPIMCWDGKCVSNRADCTPPDRCDVITPVKCPDGTCHASSDECKVVPGCPMGFLQCTDGSCRRNLIDCSNSNCPINFQFQCPNGICTSNLKYCDSANGCPYYAPSKCKDGSCESDDTICSAKKDLNIPEGFQNCPDGSVIQSSISCNLSNGCPINTPQLCADKNCIDPFKQTCTIPICNVETPIMCLNGLCVQSVSNCPSSIDISSNTSQCANSLYPCADGTCAQSPEQCKPLSKCPYGFVRCKDGSCKIDISYCPLTNTCPYAMSFRCPLNGACSSGPDYCINYQGCPSVFPIKCQNNGICANTIEDCLSYDKNYNAANGCPQNAKFKCAKNGRCVSKDPNILPEDPNLCVDPICADGFYFCYNNGRCIPFKDLKTKGKGCSQFGFSCSESDPTKPFQCPDNTCKKDPLECSNQVNCPLNSPFRCIDGSCSSYPNLLAYTTNPIAKTCPIDIQCPEYKPYLCSDGSCVEKRDFCGVLSQCPTDKPVRCSDRICRTSKVLCNSNNCPAKNPILCSNGNCVSSIFDCSDNFCPQEKPIRCSNDVCTESTMECIINKNTTYSNTTLNTPNCNVSEAVCYDGSCRPDILMCPIYEGCPDPKYPYKCQDGTCGTDLKNCFEDKLIIIDEQHNKTINLVPYMVCSVNQTLCEDGICRSKCPLYNGCPKSYPLMCPDGFCVQEVSECAGLAAICPLDYPFRCIDGTCVEDPSSCVRPKRTFVKTDVLIFIYSSESLKKDIIIDDKNNIIGSVSIPANCFSSNNNNTDIQATSLVFRSVPSESLRNTISVFNITRRDDIYREFPNADLNNKQELQYEYSILSPVINISRLNPNISSYKTPFILTLAYDFPVNIPDITNLTGIAFNPFNDICLGKLDVLTNVWNCTLGKTSAVKYNYYQFNSEIFSDGIFAVIFSPSPNTNVPPTEPNFLAVYFMYILIFSGVAILALIVGSYVFWRVYRYRDKYKDTRKEEKTFEAQMQELQQVGTAHMGQTLGDNMSHIFFTNNPSFKVVKIETKSIREIELENMTELLSKRLRVLESNGDNLKNNHLNLNSELTRLKEYHVQ